MVRLEDIDYAIDKTLLVHPEFFPRMSRDLFVQITERVNVESFTRTGNARARILGVVSDDILKYVLHECIKIYNAASFFYYNDKKICNLPSDREKINYLLEVFPCFGDLQRMMGILASKDINASLYLKGNNSDLICLITATLNTRFSSSQAPYKQYIDKYGTGQTVLTTGESVDLIAKVDQDIEKVQVAEKVQVNHRAVNKCMGDLMMGIQLKNKRNEYVLEGSLYATQDVGHHRSTQEDATILLTHPSNKDFKLLAVSDGMGGAKYGDQASSYTLQRLTEWFNTLNPDYFYYPNELREEFKKKLSEISKLLYQIYNADFKKIQAGATFTGAIVTDENTVVASVGDSRAYITRGSSLELLTRDESAVWPPGCAPEQISKQELDDLRFHKKNNYITACMGMDDLGVVQSKVIPNESYDRLMLFTDGVTDLLSTDRIRFIALNTPAEQLTQQFVNEAMLYDAVRMQGASKDYDAAVAAGKDNATVAAYVRR